jgi:hypothetical protein
VNSAAEMSPGSSLRGTAFERIVADASMTALGRQCSFAGVGPGPI